MRAIESLIPTWGAQQRYFLFDELMRLIGRNRTEVLGLAPLLAPVGYALGGDKLCDALVSEIWRVGNWCP